MADDNDTGSFIDLQDDDTGNYVLQVDAAALAAGKSFGSIALPLGISFAKAAAIEAQANMALELEGAENFMRVGHVDSTLARNRAEREKDADEDSISYIARLFGEADKQRAREREHERLWLEQSHTYAGQTLDGTQWKKMADWFRDDANVQEWEDAVMAETGQTREEARRTGGKMKRFYDLIEKDAKGTLTTEDRGEFARLNDDRDIRRGIEVQKEIQGLRRSQNADLTDQNDNVWDGAQSARAKSFAASFEDDTRQADGLASVGPLAPSYRSAALGTTVAPSAQPASPPAQTIQVNPDNMFG